VAAVVADRAGDRNHRRVEFHEFRAQGESAVDRDTERVDVGAIDRFCSLPAGGGDGVQQVSCVADIVVVVVAQAPVYSVADLGSIGPVGDEAARRDPVEGTMMPRGEVHGEWRVVSEDQSILDAGGETEFVRFDRQGELGQRSGLTHQITRPRRVGVLRGEGSYRRDDDRRRTSEPDRSGDVGDDVEADRRQLGGVAPDERPEGREHEGAGVEDPVAVDVVDQVGERVEGVVGGRGVGQLEARRRRRAHLSSDRPHRDRHDEAAVPVGGIAGDGRASGTATDGRRSIRSPHLRVCSTIFYGGTMPIRRATPHDIRHISTTAVAAFAEDPVMRWLYPDDDIYLQPAGALMQPAMKGWLRHGELWCTEDGVGVGVWIPPGRPELPGDGVEADNDGADDDGADDGPPPDLLERFEIIGPLMKEHMPDIDHWYLQLLATHPDWQRSGVGAAVMQPMFDRADAEGIPCYLETETEVNVAYYRRHGFEVVTEFDIPTGAHQHRFSSFGGDPSTEVGPHMWGMLRATP